MKAATSPSKQKAAFIIDCLRIYTGLFNLILHCHRQFQILKYINYVFIPYRCKCHTNTQGQCWSRVAMNFYNIVSLSEKLLTNQTRKNLAMKISSLNLSNQNRNSVIKSQLNVRLLEKND